MKNLSLIIGSLAIIGLGACTQNKNAATNTNANTAASATPVSGKMAYVDIDSLEANYTILKTKREEFKQRQAQMEGELQHSFEQMQSDYADLQHKAQNNTLTQPEYEAGQKRLAQMQQSLETRKQSLTDQLLKEQDEFNKDLKSRLDAFLTEYNKDKHYDFILSYSNAGSSILYANKNLDITNDVIKGMNESAKNQDSVKSNNK